MSSAGKENIIALNPVQLSPAAKLHESPHGVSFDVLIKPASACKKLVNMYSPSPSKDFDEKLRSAEKRREHMDLETQEKTRLKREKMEAAKCHVLNSIENHQKQIIAKVHKKELTVEECKINKKKELEEKRIAREQRAEEAKKIHEENLESKKKIAEIGLSQRKVADELREANRQAIADKAKKVLIKVDTTLAAQKKKYAELDEKIRTNLQNAAENRNKQLTSIKEKCGKHVIDAKTRAHLKERN